MKKSTLDILSEKMLARFSELQEMMKEPSFHQSPSFAPVSREYRNLEKKVEKFRELEKMKMELVHLEELIHSPDKEMSDMAHSEKIHLHTDCKKLETELLKSLTPRNPNDEKNIILEIRAGTGGEEAALFAGDLSRMYTKFARDNGFICEPVSVSLTGRGGFKEAIFMIEKPENDSNETGPFAIFKYEMGIHRVQRVPLTEASGRIHTSAVTVAVLPEAEEVDIQIKPEELRIDTYRASGHGGQHLQKTDSAVRITHVPTGIVVQCQDERSQQKNRAKAMKFLRAKILQIAEEEHEKKIASTRKKQVGTGDRSEKIRTYNFPQDRITDHRIGFSVHHIQEVLEGNPGAIIHALQEAEEKTRLTES